jgi:hypothetical protein
VGGNVEAQAYIYRTNNRLQMVLLAIYEEWKIWHPNVKPYNVQCFNTSDGSQIWESERFKKGITNMMTDGTDMFRLQRKSFVLFEYRNGS